MKGIDSATAITFRPCEWTEAAKAEVPRRRIGARVRAAKTTAVSERVLDLSDAPALLVQHRIVDDAADGQFRVLLDRIILKILVAAIAVEQVAPLRVLRANAAKKRDGHGCRLNVESLVVFDDSDRLLHIDRNWIDRNRLKE